VLRWHVQSGVVPIPRSATVSRLAENIGIFDFRLDEGDMAALDVLDTGSRVGPDPDTFG
jgi:2,5-diketo-D-gluconate reductase A